jgi:hypothetical protein
MAVVGGQSTLQSLHKSIWMISISQKSLVLIVMGSSMISFGAGYVLSLLAIRGGATKVFRGGAMMIRNRNEQTDSIAVCQSSSDTVTSLCPVASDTRITLPLFMRQEQQQSNMVSNGTRTTAEDRPLLRRILGPESTTDGTATQCRRRSSFADANTTGRSTDRSVWAEAMVHPALLTHEHPRHVLLVTTTTATRNNNDYVLCHVLAHRSVERVVVLLVVATNETSREFPLPRSSESPSLCGGGGGGRDKDRVITYQYVSVEPIIGLAQFDSTDRFDVILVDAMYVAGVWHLRINGGIIVKSHGGWRFLLVLLYIPTHIKSDKCSGQSSVSRVELPSLDIRGYLGGASGRRCNGSVA